MNKKKLLRIFSVALLFLCAGNCATTPSSDKSVSEVNKLPELKIRTIKTPYTGSVLFVPNDSKSHPGVLVLHGSEGGAWPFWMMEARWLAEEDFVALAYCYASCTTPGESNVYLPHVELHDVELADTAGALDWLAKSKFVAGKSVALYGISRGAEQALLLASLLASESNLTKPTSVAVHAPSDVIWRGNNWQWENKLCTLADGSLSLACGIPRSPNVYAWKWHGSYDAVKPRSRIEIENFSGPIFISHGEQDTVWSVEMTRRIQITLEHAGRHPEVHTFPGQNHILFGEAREQEQRLLLDFLNRTIGT